MSKLTGNLRPLAMALVLTIGFGAVFGLIAVWGVSIWEGLYGKNGSEFKSVVVRADGMPLIHHYVYDGLQSIETYSMLDGSEVPPPKQNGREGLLAGAVLAVPVREMLTLPLDGNVRVQQFADEQKPMNLWFFVDDGNRDGRGYFVGYDSQSKLRVGFIGRDGFRPDQPPVEQWFAMNGVKLASRRALSRFNPGNGYYYYDFFGDLRSDEFPGWKVDMISGAQLLQVDLRARSVTKLMDSPDLTSLGLFSTISTSKIGGDEPPFPQYHLHLAVRTSDRVVVFDAPGKQRSAFLLPDELRDRSINLYELGPGKALATVSRLLPDRSSHEELFWIDASGKILRQTEVALSEGKGHDDEMDGWKAAFFVPSPAIVTFIALLVPLDYVRQGLAPNYATALARSLGVFWLPLLVVTLLAGCLAWYCCRRHRVYYQQFGVLWFLFVLLAGLPGLVGYLFHRRWPVLEKCPACGNDVPRDRDTCAKCGVAFPPPTAKGCEVFA